ncbi:MAG: O-antigen ligase family protein [Verrucomicrobiota bacterium]|nr:O-antigen ligase family protein [Verrucomicrobiota bacterium]
MQNGLTKEKTEYWWWLGIVVGAFILVATVVFVPASFPSLNFFDSVKRPVWGALCLVMSGLILWRQPSQAGGRRIGLAVFALIGWMVIRTLLRPAPTAELGVLISWCFPPLLFLLGSRMPRSSRNRQITGVCLLVAGIVQWILMLLQRQGYDPLFASTTLAMDYMPERMIGTIGYHNQAVDFLALSLTGILMLTGSWVWFFCSGLAALPVILLTANRGGILAFGTTMMCMGVVIALNRSYQRGNRSGFRSAAGWVAISACLFFGGVMVVPETGTRFRELFTEFESNPSVQSRILMVRIGTSMFGERPLTGWGAGEYAFQYLDRLGSILPEEKNHTILRSIVFAREAHNDLVQFTAEFGLIGLAFIALITAIVLRAIVYSFRDFHHPPKAVPLYVFCYMSVAAVFSFPWQSAIAGPLAGLLFGLTFPLPREGVAAKSLIPERFALPFMAITALFISIGVFGWSVREAYLNTAVPSRLSSNDLDGAERLLSKVDHRYQALVGAAFAANGRWDVAIELLSHAQKGYQDALLWNNMGHVLAKTGAWPEAMSMYAAWVACGLDHANALQNLSVAGEQCGDHPLAIHSLSQRMKLWPETISVFDVKRLSVLRIKAGDLEGAAETLHRFQRFWRQGSPEEVLELERLEAAIAARLDQS